MCVFLRVADPEGVDLELVSYTDLTLKHTGSGSGSSKLKSRKTISSGYGYNLIKCTVNLIPYIFNEKI